MLGLHYTLPVNWSFFHTHSKAFLTKAKLTNQEDQKEFDLTEFDLIQLTKEQILKFVKNMECKWGDEMMYVN